MSQKGGKMRLLLSYYSSEESEAEDIADYLRATFRDQGLEVFQASSWDSLAPGDTWEDKIIK